MFDRYIVTGSAGHLGSTILRLLRNREVEVFGLLRQGEASVVEAKNIHYVHGDVCKPETLGPLFEGNNGSKLTVIHTAGIISIADKVSSLVWDVNVKGTLNMIDLGKRYGVSRFVYVSSVHAIPELPMGNSIRETEHFSPDLVTGCYAKTKAEATQIVLDAAERGFPAIVVHPSGIIGPYDTGQNHLIQMIVDYLRGKLPLCVKGGYDFVDVRDVAQGCLQAADRGKVGRCYILNGHFSTVHKLLTQVGQLGGRKPPHIVPMLFAKLAAPVVQEVANLQNRRPLYTSYSLYTLSSNSAFSRERAETELCYRPRRIEETIQDMVRWLTDPHRGIV